MVISRNVKTVIVGGLAAVALLGAAGASFAVGHSERSVKTSESSVQVAAQKIVIGANGATIFDEPSPSTPTDRRLPQGEYAIQTHYNEEWIQTSHGWLWKKDPNSHFLGTIND